MEDQHISLGASIKNFAQTFFKLISGISTLASLEAKLAGRSFMYIAILVFMAASLLVSSWIILLGIIVVALLSYEFSWISALSMVLALNLVLIGIISLAIWQLRKDLFFQATRRQLARHEKN